MRTTNKFTRSQFSEIIGDYYFSISKMGEDTFFNVFFTNGGIYADCIYFAVQRLLDAGVDLNSIFVYPIMGDIHLCVTCVTEEEVVDNVVDENFQYV